MPSTEGTTPQYFGRRWGAGMVTACHERSLMAASNSGRIAERNPCSRLLPASGENAALIATFTSVPMARFNQFFFPKRSHQGSQRRFHAGGIIGHVEERLLPSPSGTAPARHLEGSGPCHESRQRHRLAPLSFDAAGNGF